jgi:hypothetical protein
MSESYQLQLVLFPEIDVSVARCICSRKCDCENVLKGLTSNSCPEHNFNPEPNPNCNEETHWFEI